MDAAQVRRQHPISPGAFRFDAERFHLAFHFVLDVVDAEQVGGSLLQAPRRIRLLNAVARYGRRFLESRAVLPAGC